MSWQFFFVSNRRLNTAATGPTCLFLSSISDAEAEADAMMRALLHACLGVPRPKTSVAVGRRFKLKSTRQ